jgi:hypothetical protein
MGRKSASGSGIRDEQPGSYFPELRNHFFDFFGVKRSGIETVRIRDPGWKNVGSGCVQKKGQKRTRVPSLKNHRKMSIIGEQS